MNNNSKSFNTHNTNLFDNFVVLFEKKFNNFENIYIEIDELRNNALTLINTDLKELNEKLKKKI